VKNKKLHAKIESLTFISQETKDYLLSMLARNPKKRPTFSEVLTGIPFIPKTGQ
jgi:serine/threonine protein kinase